MVFSRETYKRLQETNKANLKKATSKGIGGRMEAKDWQNTIVKTDMYNCHNTLEERLAEQAEIAFKAGEDKGYQNGNIAGYNRAKAEDLSNLGNLIVDAEKVGMQKVAELVKDFQTMFCVNFNKKYKLEGTEVAVVPGTVGGLLRVLQFKLKVWARVRI